jgi:hypothetical protein
LEASDGKPEALRQDVEAVADLHDAAGFFSLGEKRDKRGGVFGLHAELAGERLFVERLVVGIGEEGNEGFTPVEEGRRWLRFVDLR